MPTSEYDLITSGRGSTLDDYKRVLSGPELINEQKRQLLIGVEEVIIRKMGAGNPSMDIGSTVVIIKKILGLELTEDETRVQVDERAIKYLKVIIGKKRGEFSLYEVLNLALDPKYVLQDFDRVSWVDKVLRPIRTKKDRIFGQDQGSDDIFA